MIEPLRHLARQGFALEWLPVDGGGRVRSELLVTKLREETRLIAVMLANHETGAVQPVHALVERRPLRSPALAFHCDAVQAVGKVPVRCGASPGYILPRLQSLLMAESTRIYTAALIVIGDEILSGRTQDKNVAQVAEWMNRQGIRLEEVRIVPDNEDRIAGAVNEIRVPGGFPS